MDDRDPDSGVQREIYYELWICSGEARNHQSGLDGKVYLKVVLSPEGVVRVAKVERVHIERGAMEHWQVLEACIVERLHDASFTAPGGTEDVVMRLELGI